MVEEIDGDKSFICSVCGKESKTGHFKWKLCHVCYFNKIREAEKE